MKKAIITQNSSETNARNGNDDASDFSANSKPLQSQPLLKPQSLKLQSDNFQNDLQRNKTQIIQQSKNILIEEENFLSLSKFESHSSNSIIFPASQASSFYEPQVDDFAIPEGDVNMLPLIEVMSSASSHAVFFGGGGDNPENAPDYGDVVPMGGESPSHE